MAQKHLNHDLIFDGITEKNEGIHPTSLQNKPKMFESQPNNKDSFQTLLSQLGQIHLQSIDKLQQEIKGNSHIYT